MLLRIGLALALCAAASTCTLGARAQAAPVGASPASASQGDEWQLDGVAVRFDAASGQLWLKSEVVVLQGEAALDGSNNTRAIFLAASTRVASRGGQPKPFSATALARAVRQKREVTVVGGWRDTARGPALQARLVIVPELLPSDWSSAKPAAPINSARKPQSPARPKPARPAAQTLAKKPAPALARPAAKKPVARVPQAPLRVRSAPRVASAPPRAEGRIAKAARLPPAPQVLAPLENRSAVDASLARPRDARRESLAASSPSASRLPAVSGWGAAPAASAPAASADWQGREPSLAMRGGALPAPQRRIEAPPALSEAPFGLGARPSGPQVLEPAPSPESIPAGRASNESVQVLADAERHAAQARQSFAALRLSQDSIPWPDFSAGPGWDSVLPSASGVSVSSPPNLLEGSSKMVALSFDDGPHPNTLRILDALEAYGARGTFFVVGRNVARDAASAAILRDVARRGHDVGSHSMRHVQGVPLSQAQWQAEVDDSAAAIAKVLGVAPRWFRAPGCRYTREALVALRARDMVRVDSSNNSGDWQQPDSSKIVSRVLSRLAPGQILLFHDPLPQTVRALPILLRELKLRGYRCVTVSELALSAARQQGFVPPVCPPGQGTVLPPEAFSMPRLNATRAQAQPQVLAAPAAPVLP